MSSFWIAQLIGAFAVVISLVVYQINKRSDMLVLSSIAAFLYSISFLLLGAYTGAATNLIGGIRCLIFFKTKPSQNNLWIFIGFGLISAVATFLTWQGEISLLALSGTLLYGLSGWQANTKMMRRLGLLAPPLWFSYNLISHSYPGMFIEIFILGSNIIGQLRFDYRQTPKLKNVETTVI